MLEEKNKMNELEKLRKEKGKLLAERNKRKAIRKEVEEKRKLKSEIRREKHNELYGAIDFFLNSSVKVLNAFLKISFELSKFAIKKAGDYSKRPLVKNKNIKASPLTQKVQRQPQNLNEAIYGGREKQNTIKMNNSIQTPRQPQNLNEAMYGGY